MELGNLIYRKKDGDHGDLKISLQISSEKKKITTNGYTGKKKKNCISIAKYITVSVTTLALGTIKKFNYCEMMDS